MSRNDPPKGDLDLWGNLLRFHRNSMAEIEKRLSENDLIPLAWYDVLIPLELSPEKQMRLKELSEKCLLTKSGVSKIMNTLEKENMVKRVRCPEDARGFHARITEKGSLALKKSWPVYRECIFELFLDRLSSNDRTALSEILRKLNESF